MKSRDLHPLILSILAFGFVMIIHQIPLDEAFLMMGIKREYVVYLGQILLKSGLIAVFIWLLFSFSLAEITGARPFFVRIQYLYYYVIPMFFLLFFSGGSENFWLLASKDSFSGINLIIAIEELISALLEEVLFRGIILGVFIKYYLTKSDKIYFAITISAFLFGIMHLVNIVGKTDGYSFQNALYQVYAAFSIGLLLCAVLLKTRNIYIIAIIHGLGNFLSELDQNYSTVSPDHQVHSHEQGLISFLIFLLIFGLPALISLPILQSIDPEEIRSLLPASPTEKDPSPELET